MADPQPRRGLWAEAQHLLGALPGLVGDRLDLLALELQRASLALAQVVVLLLAATLLAVTAWLVLWAGATVALVQAGVHWAAALAVVLVLNAVCAALAIGRIPPLVARLTLPATRRHLRFGAEPGFPANPTHPERQEHAPTSPVPPVVAERPA